MRDVQMTCRIKEVELAELKKIRKEVGGSLAAYRTGEPVLAQ